MSLPLKSKDVLLMWNDLRAKDAVYHIQCSSNFRTGKGSPKKNIMLKKCGIHTTTESHSDEQFDTTNMRKMMEEKLSGSNVSYLT